MKKNNLPNIWCVKNDGSEKFKKILDYLNDKYDQEIGGEYLSEYYGENIGLFISLSYFGKILTIDEFLELSKPLEEFVVPEKWCIRGCNELKHWQTEEMKDTCTHLLSYESHHYYTEDPNFVKWDSCTGGKPKGYTEITFDQFKQYVLKQDEVKKKVIGYKFKKGYEKFDYAVKVICDTCNSVHSYCDLEPGGYSFAYGSLVMQILREAQVLDLWFEPVYKQDVPNIIVNGYKVKFQQNSVIVNEHTYDDYLFINLTIDQISEIRDYFIKTKKS